MTYESLGRRIAYIAIIGGLLLVTLWDALTHKQPHYEVEQFESTGKCAVHRITDGAEIGEDKSELVFVGSCDTAREKYPNAESRD